MKTVQTAILVVGLLLLAACSRKPSGLELQDALARALPHDASIKPPDTVTNYTHELTTEGTNWIVTARWNPGELSRWVTWQEEGSGFTIVIPLRIRPTPFTTSWGATKATFYGPYQPACVHHQGRDDWHVMMSHERADFPTEEDLRKMLEMSIPGQPHAHPVLSPDGIMVTLRGPSYSGTTSLDVEILILTVNGHPPPASLLKPFVTGKITIRPNQAFEAIGDPGSPQPQR